MTLYVAALARHVSKEDSLTFLINKELFGGMIIFILTGGFMMVVSTEAKCMQHFSEQARCYCKCKDNAQYQFEVDSWC